MDESTRESSSRSRFGNVVNTAELPSQHWGDESGRYSMDSREAAVAVGAKNLGYAVVSLAPGRRSCPYHFHHSEEEMFFVLDGRGTLRQGDEEGEERIELRRGDCVAFPPGTGIAHQFINDGEEPFVYLAVSNRIQGDLAEYPDSDKILVRSTRMMLRRTPKLDYFDGEV